MEEFPIRHGSFDRTVDVIPDQTPIGRLAVLLSQILAVVTAPTQRLLDDRDPILQTQPVRLPLHRLIVCRGVKELVSVDQRYRIKNEMIMIMIGITVCRNHHLIFISP